MICRASAGPSAPELGAHLQVNSGLSGESVRTRQTLRCDDAETDPRVNRESCRMLGIASVVVMPLVRAQEANGVFELLSGRAYAFEERDITALERLGEMIQTAVEHAEAAKRTQKEIDGKETVPPDEFKAEAKPDAKPAVQPPAEGGSGANSAAEAAAEPEPTSLEEKPEDSDQPQAPPNERGNIGKCEKCGFPVSEGRTLCLDCETAQVSDENSVPGPASSQAPGFRSIRRCQEKRLAAVAPVPDWNGAAAGHHGSGAALAPLALNLALVSKKDLSTIYVLRLFSKSSAELSGLRALARGDLTSGSRSAR
jgi:hypothetical protein